MERRCRHDARDDAPPLREQEKLEPSSPAGRGVLFVADQVNESCLHARL